MTELAIHSLCFENYKNLVADCRVDLGALNILIGPNASGKSNLTNLLEFLKDAVSYPADTTSSVTFFDRAVIQLGGDHILDRSVDPPGVVKLSFEFPGRKAGDNIFLDLDLLVQGHNRKVIINQELLYQVMDGGKKHFHFYKAHDRGSGSGEVSIYENGSTQAKFQVFDAVPVDDLVLVALPRLLENSNYPPESTPAFPVRRRIVDSISTWQFYNANDMNLQAIRLAEPRLGPSDEFLSPSGENLPLVLENLSQGQIDFEDRLNLAMRDLLPWTHRVRAARSGRLSLVAEWYLAPPGKPREQYYLSDMSDGSVRMLCWATVLLAPKLPGLLVIEEPEIGVHVAWLGKLAEWIEDAAQRTQVIVSTHSPDLLDHFTDQLQNVLVMSPSNDHPARFCVKRLRPDALQPSLAEGWQLGDLYRVGDPNVGGWPW